MASAGDVGSPPGVALEPDAEGSGSGEQPNILVPNVEAESPNEKSNEQASSNPSLSGVDSSSSIRARRTHKVSPAGKASKISELNLNIVKKINSECRTLAKFTKVLSEGVTLDQLYDIYDDVESRAVSIQAMYNELHLLYDSDESQINENIKLMYVAFISRADEHKTSMMKQMDAQEEIDQQARETELDDKRKQIEEEKRMFEEFMRQNSEIAPPKITMSVANGGESTAALMPIGATAATTYNQTSDDNSPLRIEHQLSESTNEGRPRSATLHNLSEIKQTPTTPTLSTTSESSAISTLLKGFTEALAGSHKKSVEPEIFSGDVMKFSDWEVDLDEYLKAERVTGSHRLRHLKKFIHGEARKCVESHLAVNTDEAYQEARSLLSERYGNEQAITRSFHKKLNEWPPIKPKDAKGLREYSDFLCYLQSAMKTQKELGILDNCIENERMAAKLPDWLRLRWPRVVAMKHRTEKRYPTFSEFSDFVKDEAFIMNLEISQTMQQDRRQGNRGFTDEKPSNRRVEMPRNIGTLRTAIDDDHYSTNRNCLYCELDNHNTAECFKLQKVDKEERDRIIRDSGWCFRCLGQGHRSKECPNRKYCQICRKPHATVNHDPNWTPRTMINSVRATPQGHQVTVNSAVHEHKQPPTETDQKQPTKELTCKATGFGNGITNMVVPVYLSAGTGREILVYAMLDNMSDACYISANVVKMLKATANDTEVGVTIHTINGAEQTDIDRFDELMLRGYSTDNYAQISAYKRDHVYCKRDQIPNPDKARKVPHLTTIADAIPHQLDIPIGLLIGSDHPEVIQPLESKPAPKGTVGLPFGVRTLFGWTIGGGTNNNSRTAKQAYKTTTSTDLMSLLERDFKDTERNEAPTSQEDAHFLQIMKDTTKQNSAGNYVLALPLKKTVPVDLPNNRVQAVKRLEGLFKKFKADPDYHKEYRDFMESLIREGHAEEAPETSEIGKVWYLPHFGVRHKQKKKLRVVMDASARFREMSLNDILLSGPDHMNSLVGILLRFRKEPIAITSDIQKMFYNFLVDDKHKDYLRFLWVDENLQKITDYRMNVHLFGATSSPAVATYGLRKLADDYESISPSAAEFLKHNFYVDDGVISVPTVEKAKELIKASIEICAKGNVRLHKFLSNNKEVLTSVPKSERSESTKNLNLFQDQLPQERTLGMEWCVETDSFHFSKPAISKGITKRGILSMIAQIYDPLGLISPVILKGKQILQQVTASELSWDQLLQPEQAKQWTEWVQDLNNLVQIKIARCVKPPGCVKSIELHHFSDASQRGYGACSYIRQIQEDGKVECNLIFSKARVAPLKKITTIPRLELQGAVTAVRTANTIKRELKMKIDKETFWTDSNIVLGYIQNEAKRFHVFVANRVAEINQSTIPKQWCHVSSDDNPADIASRGASARELVENEKWLHGPSFLQEPDISHYIQKNQKSSVAINPEDPEIRKVTHATTVSKSLVTKYTKFSCWKTLVKSMSILRACIRNKRESGKAWRAPQISVQDLIDTEEFIIRTVQEAAFPAQEMEPSLKDLNPQLDEKGVMRIGGRAEKAAWWNYTQKHPAIIPKHSHVANLIIGEQHQQIHHLGYRSTLCAVRESGYWIVNGSCAIKKHLKDCLPCKKLRAQPGNQKMGDLPIERLERTAPFTHVGMDVFGPFYVKDRRTEAKRWGLVITCLYSRAIHLEVLEDMTTDCLILAMRCFMAVRGPISTITCDNGTNFVGMRNELSRQQNLADEKMKQYLESNRIDMNFNPPKASHQGGVTERMIRSIRAILNGINLKYRMDTKTLRTVLFEVASIVNNRPLTGTAILDPNEETMTPNRLLTMKTPLVAPPPGEFPMTDTIYSTKRWKVAQAVADEFWRAWRSEYWSTIMPRQKWSEVRRNLKVGDIVMVMDESAARSDWKLGRVSRTTPGKDGLVRDVEITLGNKRLDKRGIPLEPSTVLRRSVNKTVLLLNS